MLVVMQRDATPAERSLAREPVPPDTLELLEQLWAQRRR